MALVRTYLPTYLPLHLITYLTVEQKIGLVSSFLSLFLSSQITSFSAVGLKFSLFMLQPNTFKPNQQNSLF